MESAHSYVHYGIRTILVPTAIFTRSFVENYALTTKGRDLIVFSENCYFPEVEQFSQSKIFLSAYVNTNTSFLRNTSLWKLLRVLKRPNSRVFALETTASFLALPVPCIPAGPMKVARDREALGMRMDLNRPSPRFCHIIQDLGIRLKTHRLFQVDIDRREQCCAANYEQVVNHVVPSCYSWTML
jgi:hypothetical protein